MTWCNEWYALEIFLIINTLYHWIPGEARRQQSMGFNGQGLLHARCFLYSFLYITYHIESLFW
jgi:hypothetical protein